MDVPNSGSGKYILSGTGSLSCLDETVGVANGSGLFTQSGGTNTVALVMYLGYSNGATNPGTFALSGSGVLSVSGSLFLGDLRPGEFNQSGGTSVINCIYTAESSTSTGTLNLNGGLAIVSAITTGTGSVAFNFSGGTLRADRRSPPAFR